MDMLPKTVKEAASILLSELSGRDKLRLRNMKKEDIILYNLGWGAEIRNRFDIWSGNDALIKDSGVDHPDGVSTVIMEAIWEELQKL